MKDNWEEQFKAWKAKKHTSLIPNGYVPRETTPLIIPNKSEPLPAMKTYDLPHNTHKLPLWLTVSLGVLPVIIILVIIYLNVLASHTFEYSYDIGSGNENILTPVNRVSAPIDDGSATFRNISSSLVYFSVPLPNRASEVRVFMRYHDDFGEGGALRLGARDKEDGHYTYKTLYAKSLKNLEGLSHNGSVYALSGNSDVVTKEELKKLKEVVIATDQAWESTPNEILSDFSTEEQIIKTPLRGGHSFWVVLDKNLDFTIKKQDLNWYEGEDNLTIRLYDTKGNSIESVKIKDDGEVNASKKIGKVIEGRFFISGLEMGVYQLVIEDFDGLVREMEINSNKIVSSKLYLARSSVYGLPTNSSSLVSKNKKEMDISLITYHSAGLQNVSWQNSGINQTFVFNVEDSSVGLTLPKGESNLSFPLNDIIVSSPGYFSFTPEQWFEPFAQSIVTLSHPWEWLEANVDYIVTEYNPPNREGQWLRSEAVFNVENDSLYAKDQVLSMVISIPHLGNGENATHPIPIDWIDVEVYKPGVWK